MVANRGPGPLCDLDALPYPDYDDYFERLRQSPFSSQFEPLIFFETSRGCWWGEKHHCAFCGLNGCRMTYRSKSPVRVRDELVYLCDRHHILRGAAADNIFDPRYFNTLLPLLNEANLGFRFMFEMKANVSRPQVELLVAAGLMGAQLGIETLSTPILRLMGKGTTAMQNLQTLKWFSEAGVVVRWNFLYGAAGEDAAQYATMADLLPALVHLAPPQATGRVRSDRFSPYFLDPDKYGIVNLRPSAAFGHVFPFAIEALAELAYYYDYDYADGRHVEDYVGGILERIAQWQDVAHAAALRYFDRGDGVLLIQDTRPGATTFQHRLSGPQRMIYLYCDAGRTLAEILGHIAAAAWDEAAVGRFLHDCLQSRIMALLDDRYLSLALRAPAA